MALKKKGVKRVKNTKIKKKEANEFVEPEKAHIRSTYGRKLNAALMRGLDEVMKEDPEFGMTEEDVQDLTNKICDVCHDYYGYDRREFKQRIFDIYINIKRDNNYDLRRKIITKAMTVHDLVHADTLQLAPDHLQQKRQIEVEKHYLRNVILPADSGDGTTSPATDSRQTPKTDDNEADWGSDASTHKYATDLDSSFGAETQDVNSLFGNESSSDSQSESDSDDEPQDQHDTNHVMGALGDSGDKGEQSTADSNGPRETKRACISPAARTGEVTDTETKEWSKEVNMNIWGEDSDEKTLFKQQKIESENEGSPHLQPPPDGSQFTLERVMERIETRLGTLPAYVAKPFKVPLKCGHKRVTLLMARSHILQNKQQDEKET
ncbi:uncharacterized protein BXIN_2104 [Babesia sp. Xinjiang]|uniref:uncharacterized protein n=1 Tax=Babesia sp. Xinjiang TaxID=462227 RepID=UPI000A24B6F6|nr:uncharacterized protein BXIN_2104 [Babesia sp. Xinjiang]ORM40622.1 hypothetical protein BXIN_2104 [Babesia sp. Xinjiang]